MTQATDEQRNQVMRVALTEMPASHPFITNPVPVGVAGFALTTFTLGLYTSGWFNPKGAVVVLPLAAFYGGLTQWIAGWFALRRGDLFAAGFMTTYGAFWFSFVALNLFVVPRAGAGATQATTIFLIMWTVITVMFTLAAMGTNWAVLATFIEFDITLIVAFVGSGTGIAGITDAAGYLEMVLGAMAWYIVMAEFVNATVNRSVFPLFPFRKPLVRPAAQAPAISHPH
ncbi:MAG TPA: acetate uptake transporter [Streptosporangiaceae bacterium]|nr:acetate uptake transporter [Streptosporangiaceae bacterium]